MTEDSSAGTRAQPLRAFGAIVDLTAALPPPPDHVERMALVAAEMQDLLPFSELPLPDELRRAIDDLGFQRTTPIQTAALPQALRGRDVLGQAQTGTGKTATFLLTIFKELLETPRAHPVAPRAIVVAPTRELALQITEDAEVLGRYTDLAVVAVFGGMDWEKQARKLGDPVDVLVGTPGRLMDYCKRGLVTLRHAQVVVVDEADRMFDMGFLDDIRWILGQCPSDRQTLMFSATFPFEITRLAQRFQRNPLEIRVQPEQVAARTIEQLVYHVSEFEKLQLTLGLLDQYKPRRCLVFVNTKRTGDYLNFKLWHNGWESGYISGDLPQRRRMQLVEEFREGKVEVLVATDVAARGLHIDDVDLVINFEIPSDANDYVHRIGRTGRAGNAGRAITMADERLVAHLPEIERLLGHQIEAKVPEDDQFLRDQAPSYRETVLKDRPRPSRDARGRSRTAKPMIWSPPTASSASEPAAGASGSRGAQSAARDAAAGPDREAAGDGDATGERKRKRRRGRGRGEGSAGGAGGGDVGGGDAGGDAGGGTAAGGANAGPSAATGAAGDGGAASDGSGPADPTKKRRRRRGGRRRGGAAGEPGPSTSDAAGGDGEG